MCYSYNPWQENCTCSLSLLHLRADKFILGQSTCRPVKCLWKIGSIYFCMSKNSRFIFLFFLLYCLSHARSLNELRVLLLESHRHSRDMEKDLNQEVHKSEWKVKEQKLQDDIKTLREKLLLLVRKKNMYSHIFLKLFFLPLIPQQCNNQ